MTCSSSTSLLALGMISLSFFFFFEYLFIWLCWILVATHGIFSCSMRTLSCGMWDLVPWQGVEPGPPVLGCLHGSVLATGPPGKSLELDFWAKNRSISVSSGRRTMSWIAMKSLTGAPAEDPPGQPLNLLYVHSGLSVRTSLGRRVGDWVPPLRWCTII